MTEEEQAKIFDDAIKFHKLLDKRWGKESPNDSWHSFLAEYYNKLGGKENELFKIKK